MPQNKPSQDTGGVLELVEDLGRDALELLSGRLTEDSRAFMLSAASPEEVKGE